MSPVFAAQSPGNKLTPTKGQTFGDLIGSAKLEDVGLFNWGTKDEAAIRRALIELVGCQKADPDPLKCELDPSLGTGGAIYRPDPWTPDKPLEAGKTHTFNLKKRLPMPAVAITELTPWFQPNDPSKKCQIRYRVEGVDVRADKTDVEVHVARYRDRQGKSESSYYEIKKVPRGGSLTVADPVTNPVEESQAPSGTHGPDDTYIWRKEIASVTAPSETRIEWDGESTATAGVLETSGSGTTFINSSCAPYSVVVRYFKNDADKPATITFDEAFYPRWKVQTKGGPLKLDLASLVVRWTVKHGAKKKLAHGQLQVIDKNNVVVRTVALDKTKLDDKGEVNLAPLWPESEVKRDAMPYRIQIQAHSGPDEAEGLAIAVMPTQVRFYDYKRVQFLGFHVKPPSPYAGDPNHDVDIAARVTAMLDAVKVAKTKSNAAEDILKVFMAPEFYFRGPEGAYPVEKIETIMPKLREESDKIEYKDWMFVFGSAIGYQKHDPTGTNTLIVHDSPSHGFTLSDVTATEATVTPDPGPEGIAPERGWWLLNAGIGAKITNVTQIEKHKKYKLQFAPRPGFTPGAGEIQVPAIWVLRTDPPNSSQVRRIRVKSVLCEDIPTTTAGGRMWGVEQFGVTSWITKCERSTIKHDEFWLTLATKGKFVAGAPVALLEPQSTEITNVALVQKGYPSPYLGDGNLSHAAVYKEYISHIDFMRDRDLDWDAAGAQSREITIHGTPDRPVIPTFGSKDMGGGVGNVKRPKATATPGSEINKTGIGGGVVYTMTDITFGLEVCLDHGENRLWNFYNGTDKTAVAKDPQVQVLLIPSWGMTIGGGKIHAPAGTGPVFNVDGNRGDSIVRLNDGTSWCDSHPHTAGTVNTDCTQLMRKYVCPTCSLKSTSPGNCIDHTGTALRAKVTCMDFKLGCAQPGCDVNADPVCAHQPKTKPLFVCKNCNKKHRAAESCGCTSPLAEPSTWACEHEYDEGGNCPECGGNSPATCSEKFAAIGTPQAVAGTPTKVASAVPPYFTGMGSVVAYPPLAIPGPNVV